jgi:hypothetical protein
MKRHKTLLILAVVAFLFTPAGTLTAQQPLSGSEPDRPADQLSVTRVIGQVELESDSLRRVATVGAGVSPDTRVRLAPEAALVITSDDSHPIRIMGQGTWLVSDLIRLARAQRETGLVLLGLNGLTELPVATIDDLLVSLGSSAPGLRDLVVQELPVDPDWLLAHYHYLQEEYEGVVRDLIAYLGRVEPNGDVYTKAMFAHAHLLIDYFAYADALESLGRFLRHGHASDSVLQHAYLLQAVGFLGLGNRGSARYYLRAARDLDSEADLTRTASYFLEQLP